MIYENIRKALFLSRPNRFIARISLSGEEKLCHVKNTGRCKELLLPGREIYVQEFPKEAGKPSPRKTAYDLIAVQKGDRLINMDSQAPNKVTAEMLPFLFPRLLRSRAEVVYGDSRFDFGGDYLPEGEEAAPRRFFLEVKGVTLEREGEVLFPDAPTARGSKHLAELIRAKKEGYDAAILFLVQMEAASRFRPNDETDPLFASTLRRAAKAGVRLFAYTCAVTPQSLAPGAPLPICL